LAKTSGGGYFEVVTDENRSVDYFGQSTWCDLAVPPAPTNQDHGELMIQTPPPPLPVESRLAQRCAVCAPRPEERVFCSRTLNLRSIKVVGYDMDYTLVHYKWAEWEALAYECTKQVLAGYGFPVHDVRFDDADLVVRGLVIDKENGNFLKIDRHGFVRRAMHAFRRLSEAEIDSIYGRTMVDLRYTSRYAFLNTLFSVSEGVLYAQMVAKLDSGALFREARPPFDAQKASTYADLYRAVSKALSKAHTHQTSSLKAAVAADPERFTQRDASKLRATLADQRSAGKKLVLITNSGWWYTNIMMRYVLGDDPDWRDLFDCVFVSARKPAFFTTEHVPCYELVVDPGARLLDELCDSGTSSTTAATPSTTVLSTIGDPLLRETNEAKEGSVYCGGSARYVEKLFGCAADDVLYVGDHVFVDANAVKKVMRWRTALVVQELENEILAYNAERQDRTTLDQLLVHKDMLQAKLNDLRCHLRRYEDAVLLLEEDDDDEDAGASVVGDDDDDDAARAEGRRRRRPRHRLDADPLVVDDRTADLCRRHMAHLVRQMADLDDRIRPIVHNEGYAFNRHWGFLSRAGHDDKSHLQRQVEKYADVYTARVTNFLPYTPYHYFRAHPQPLAHDTVDHDYNHYDADHDLHLDDANERYL